MKTKSVVLQTELDESEVSSLAINEEYEATRWLAPQHILSDPRFHPALHQCAQAVLESL